MNETNQDRIDKFLLTLEKALGDPREQAKGIVEEVSADLHAHISRHLSEGRSEEEAVGAALSEMGSPSDLANQVRQVIPPFGGTAATVIRYVLATATILWLLMLMWVFRAWTYGFPGLAAVVSVTFLHLPVILLLWPRIVWRRNWLFGLIPAGMAFVFALFMNFGAVESSETVEIPIPQNGEEFVPPETEEPSHAMAYLIFTTAVVVAFVLFLAIQQRSQRRIVLLTLVLPIALIEAAFQWEEHVFRQDRNRALEYFQATFRKTGSYPSDKALETDGPRFRAANYWIVRTSDDDLSLFWSRPLRPGCSLAFSTNRKDVWVQD